MWAELTAEAGIPNWLNRSLLSGFQSVKQVELTAPYAAKFFDVVADVWARSDSEPAQEFVMLGYPVYQISEETIALTDGWLARDGQPASLRRLVAEGRDGVQRALNARAKDLEPPSATPERRPPGGLSEGCSGPGGRGHPKRKGASSLTGSAPSML